MNTITKSCFLCNHWRLPSPGSDSGVCTLYTSRPTAKSLTAEIGMILVSSSSAHIRTHKYFLCKKFTDKES